MRPRLLRPPVRFFGRSSDFSGSVFVISAKSATVPKRRPGEVGLYCLSGIGLDPLESGAEDPAERLAFLQGDERLLPVRRLDGCAAAGPLGLAFDDAGVHCLHLTAAQLL